MNTRLASHRLWLPILVLAVLVPCLVRVTGFESSAQTTTTGQIEGTLVDVNGVPIPNADVTVTGAGGSTVSATTNEGGIFRITQLRPGQYTITVERSKDFLGIEKSNVEVLASRTTKVNLDLSPAPIADGPSEGEGDILATGTRIPPRELTSARPIPVGDALEFKVDTTKFGTMKAYLPNDIRPGDTVSGSLVWEKPPVGGTETVKVESSNATVTQTANDFAVRLPTELPIPSRNVLNLALLVPPATAGVAPEKVTLFIPLNNLPVGRLDDFVFPPLSQQGRAINIQGPFDGNSANTSLRFGVPNSPQSGEGTGKVIKLLAESPRTLVFIAPVDVTGPYTIDVKEGDKTFTGNSRNIAVNLRAPKTNLLRGEKTTLTIEVSGLQGIIKDVPLQLDAKGVINMDGGNFQNLRIKPEEVKLDGRYTTDRGITGLSAGGFSVTATVIVGPFDICLQDDVDPGRAFRWNTFTGDYAFTNPAPPKTPGGTIQPGGAATGGSGTPPTVTPPTGLTGIGKPTMKGCIITLSHNAPDRRVFARLDTCTKTGDASVETKTPNNKAEVKDKNTGDNTCPSAPK